MDILTLVGAVNYALVLIYGLFLSANIAGGWRGHQQKRLLIALSPLFLLIQGSCWLLWDITVTRQLYPLIVHLPLVLILVVALKKKLSVALVSVCTAYLCCQLPRWVALAVTVLFGSPLAGEISYTLSILPIYLLLCRYFVCIAYDAMSYSSQTLFLFGSLPLVYYVFDYATTIYSDVLYAGIPALVEFFPTAAIIFYVAFLSAYHAQTQKRIQAEQQRSILESALKQSGTELESLRRMEAQTAIYRHDMRHHLNMIDGFLAAGNPTQAAEYIQSVHAGVDAITPKRFCENETLNLLCASFSSKAERAGIELTATIRLAGEIPFPDTELCSLLSNGLENALYAAKAVENDSKWVKFYCEEKAHQLLIEIRNPYCGVLMMQDGIPCTNRPGHGYGCRSICAIAEKLNGLCRFAAENGVFTLRVILPIMK